MNKQDWTYKKLGEVCEKASSNIAQNKIANLDGDYPVFGASGFVQNVDFYHRETPYIGIVKDGSGVGRVNIYPAYSSLLGTMQYIIPKEGNLLGYIAYALKGLNLSSFASGAAIPHIYFKDYSKCKIPVPPIAEQERIVAELDLLSGIIEKKKEQLKAYDQLAQSIFYTMFGDPVTNEKGWDVIQLGSKCEVSSFKRVLIEDVVDKGIPFIRGTELMSLSKGEKTPFTLFIKPEHYEKVKAISGVPKIGDLLIPSINANGSIWVLNTEEPRYYKDGRVLWVHVDNNTYTSQALKYIMHNLIMSNYSSVASGATFAELKLFVLRELNTIQPPLSLQQEFAEKVDAIERQKALVQQSIVETQTMFDCTMDKYFG